MHQLIAILLIPIFVVGNSFAHSHESAEHSSAAPGRAHIHMGKGAHHHASHVCHDHDHGHSHHDHHHHSDDRDLGREDSTPGQDPVDHDSDAIYLVSVDLALNCGDRPSVEDNALTLVYTTDFSSTDIPARTQRPQLDHSPPPQRLPLYLLNVALRL